MKRPPLTFLLALLTVFASGYTSATQAGQVYRWVDDNGQVHFGSQPPPEQRTTAEQYKIQTSQPATPPPPPATEKEAPSDEEGEIITLNPGVSKEQAKEYCQKAQDFMLAIQGSYSTRFKQEDGSFRPFTKEERTAKEKQAMEMMDQFCTKKK